MTSALLYVYSLPLPNSNTTQLPQPETSKARLTSAYQATYNSSSISKPRTSSSDAATMKSIPSEDILNPTLSIQEKKSFFLQSRQTFGSTALVLQGGSVFGLCHVGVVRGLWKRGLLPRILVGWGVGGLIASLGNFFLC